MPVVILDPDTGTFLFSRNREGSDDELLTQLWAPVDFFTVDWKPVDWPVETYPARAVVMVWLVGPEGDEREVNLDWSSADGFARSEEILGERSGLPGVFTGYRLLVVDQFPDPTPSVIRRAIEDRERARVAQFNEVRDRLESAEGKNVLLRLFGVDAIGGKLKTRPSVGGTVIVLDKPSEIGCIAHEFAPDQLQVWSLGHGIATRPRLTSPG